ncbi:hypothetical protein ACF0H5_015342 [Mactra antiquata]
MGNNNSHSSPPPATEVVRRPPTRPNAPPSARPISDLGPKGPSYHSPENQVLPREIPSILKLRPVSMELSKYNPEFSDIFAHETKDNLDDNENEIDTNEDTTLPNSPPRPPPPVPNGFGPASPNGQIPNGTVPTPPSVPSTNTKTNLPYRPSHRRQMSLGQEPTILEEPEEIESRVKLDPLMQSFPGATGPSLPVKNNFNLDYSYQLTYVQLAEHRRNKTIEELEKRTGKRLSDLSADLSEHVETPTFVRGAASRTSSKSEGSAISSKKKKAPLPPGQAPPPPPTSPRTSQQYSIDNEPPVDYDMESPRRPPPPKLNATPPSKINSAVMLPRYTASPKSKGSPDTSKAPPAPPVPGSSGFKKPANISRTPSMSDEAPKIVLRKTPDVKAGPQESDGKVPWLLEIKNLSEARAARRQMSQEAVETQELPSTDIEKKTEDNDVNENKPNVEKQEDVKPKLVFESSSEKFTPEKPAEQTDAEKNKPLERSTSMKENTKPPSPKLHRHHSTTGFDHPVSSVMQRQMSEPAKTGSPNDPVRRLNSLLQHDIKAAANAKCLKLVKQTTPVPPKPKDPHTVFREQLQKACAARDERAKTEGTIDEKLQRSFDSENLENDMDRSSASTPRKEKSEAPDTLPKPPRYHKNIQMNRNSNMYSRVQRGQSQRDEKQGGPIRQQQQLSMSLDWTPEDDLGSDDNLSDREVLSNRQGASDGFKSTIIPNTMTEMKTKKKTKSKKPKDMGSTAELNKNKFGSVKKLKKSMHKSVKNAFGSISKASGKILRRQKSEDFEQVDDVPKNWSLTANSNGTSNRSSKYQIPMEYNHDAGSDSENEEYGNDKQFSEVIFRQNDKHDSEESSDSTYESEDKAPQNIRRAGVAYISAKGQLVLMKDEDEEDEIENRKVREKKKKKKDKSATLERATEELREKEKRLEEEKRKQLEMELELHKRREAETRERLQRLENAHLQQQLTAAQLLQQQTQQQQQQQQQHLGVLSAPPLPPAGNFQPFGSLPDTTHTQTPTFTNIFGQQLPQNGFQSNFGIYSQSNPYLNNPMPGIPMDINDYMRRLGVQNPPTSQQMAYFLNNMTLAGQPFERKTNPVAFDMFNQQFPTGALNFQGIDPNMKKSGFQNWASTPNINTGAGGDNVPINDFVTSYNGASESNGDNKDDVIPKSRNPLYNSEDSDEGLSPKKSLVRAQVKDFRQVPVRTESGKFMRKYASENFVPIKTNTEEINNKSFTDVTMSNDFNHRQRSVSPSNSVSTVDSAMSSPSVTLSTPSSPTRSADVPPSPLATRSQNSTPGFKTVLDLTSPDGGAMQIISTNGDQVKL